jgi:anion-transporting  ArsA/GET3 family ATPase
MKLKDHISNSSSRPTTHSNSTLKRLYIITGKGGVGKTTTAISLSKHLIEEGYNVLYNSFDTECDTSLLQKLDIPYFQLHKDDSFKMYVAKKLNSDILGSWVMKAPFAHSLLNIIPGLGSMILLGHLMQLLQDDPTLTIVLDSPSSGHVLTMLESPANFKEIFQTGAIVEDIRKMETFMTPETMKVCILALPTMMAIHEGIELKEELLKRKISNTEIILNDSLRELLNDSKAELPEFLLKRLELENSVFSEYEALIGHTFPSVLSTSNKEIILKLVSFMGGIL